MEARPLAFDRTAPRLGVRAATDSYRYARALLVIFLATAVDVFNVLDRSSRGGPVRYLILLIPVAALLAIRADGSTMMRSPAAHERALIALFVFGLVGTSYGILFLGVTSTARALFLPMSIAILALFVVQPLTSDEARKLTRALAWIATIYIVLGAVVYSGLVPGLAEFRQFKNATFPYVTIGISAAYMLHRRFWAVALMGLAAVIFVGYSSATSVLVVLVTVVAFLATGRTASRARPYAIAIAAVVIAAVAVANFGRSEELAGRYFEAVGKRNTTQGRIEFWANGIAEFQASPFIGAGFASDTVVEASRERQSPYHNDFVMFLAEGGLLGTLLLLGWLGFLFRILITRYFGFVRTGEHDRAVLARLVLIGLVGFVVAMVFNPVLEGLSRSATIFALAAIGSMLGDPDETAEVPATVAAPAPATRAARRSRVR